MMIFITHQIPRGLQVDEMVELGSAVVRQMGVWRRGRRGNAGEI